MHCRASQKVKSPQINNRLESISAGRVPDGFPYYNKDMFTGSSLGDAWKSQFVAALLNMVHMNRYIANWPVVLDALRQLWETGKVSELRTPFYEPELKRQQ